MSKDISDNIDSNHSTLAKESLKGLDHNSLHNYFIEFSYLGANYHGWQRQSNAVSVQETLESALSTILNKEIQVTGSSRTDTGVHALQQFAHFHYQLEVLDLDKTIHRLNRILPSDIAIKNIYELPTGAHSRFDAISRTYQYWIVYDKDPFMADRALHLNVPLNIEKLNEASGILKEHRDFKSFAKTRTQVNNFNCNIEYAEWYHTSDYLESKKTNMSSEIKGHSSNFENYLFPSILVFEIKANRFLRSMVRNIVGTMIEVGCGKISLEEFENIILARDVRLSGKCISPHGLYLKEVCYPEGLIV